MEDPEASGSARKIDLDPIEQDGMRYHAPLEVNRSEKFSDFDLTEQYHEQSRPRHSNREKTVIDLRLRGKPSGFPMIKKSQKPFKKLFLVLHLRNGLKLLKRK